jgi:hypothetical protein
MRSLVFALGILTSFNHALAKEGETAAATSAPTGSAANRAGKMAYVGAEVVGLTLFPGQGVRAGYFVNQDLIAELSYAFAGFETSGFELNKSLIEVKGKYFLGNSFYVDGGLAIENWGIKTTIDNQSVEGDTSTMG